MQRFWQHPKVIAGLQYAAYTLFFLLIMLVAIPWTFPTRQLRSYVTKQARQAGYPLEIEEIKLRGLGGVELSGVTVTLPGKPGEPVDGGGLGPGLPEVDLKVDRISAKIALLPVIFGRTMDIRFDIEAGGGTIEDGRVVKKGEVFDFEIGKIDGLSLAGMGIGKRALGPQTSLLGDLDGKLGGKMQVHFGGSTDDMTGAVDLELADAILRSPELSIQGGLRLQDLGVGTFTLKIRMNLKQNIAALSAMRGAEKATVLHIEQMQAEGDQLELITEETSHIMIPPGKAGWKAATLQLHFAFALPDKPSAKKKPAKEGDDKAAADSKDEKPVSDRIKWASLLTLAGKKLQPFERGGFIGIGCTGQLSRPVCKPELPQVQVGVHGAAKADGAAPPAGAPVPGAVPVDPAAGTQPAPAPEFQPVARPEPAPAPVPSPSAAQEAVPAPAPPPEPAQEQRPGGRPQQPPAEAAQPPPAEGPPRRRGEGDEGGAGRGEAPPEGEKAAEEKPDDERDKPGAPEGGGEVP